MTLTCRLPILIKPRADIYDNVDHKVVFDKTLTLTRRCGTSEVKEAAMYSVYLINGDYISAGKNAIQNETSIFHKTLCPLPIPKP